MLQVNELKDDGEQINNSDENKVLFSCKVTDRLENMAHSRLDFWGLLMKSEKTYFYRN